eukprot:1163488_1
MTPPAEIWRTADCVCFDVDSTLLTEESIDMLAEHCGVKEQVAAVTTKAMNGEMTFQDSLKARLGVIKPSKTQSAEVKYGKPHTILYHEICLCNDFIGKRG